MRSGVAGSTAGRGFAKVDGIGAIKSGGRKTRTRNEIGMIDVMIKRLTGPGLPVSIALALAIDYPWGDFQGHTHWQNVAWIPFVSPPVHAIRR